MLKVRLIRLHPVALTQSAFQITSRFSLVCCAPYLLFSFLHAPEMDTVKGLRPIASKAYFTGRVYGNHQPWSWNLEWYDATGGLNRSAEKQLLVIYHRSNQGLLDSNHRSLCGDRRLIRLTIAGFIEPLSFQPAPLHFLPSIWDSAVAPLIHCWPTKLSFTRDGWFLGLHFPVFPHFSFDDRHSHVNPC